MRLLCLVLGLTTVLLLAAAGQATAHDVSEHSAPGVGSDLRSVLVSERLPDGVTVHVLGNGQALLLRNGLLLVTATEAAAVLWSSTVLVALPATLDRLLVITALGLAAGYLLALPLDRAVRAPAAQCDGP